MNWKTVSSDSLELGDFNDSVFFGLEELDGNAYKLTKISNGYSVEKYNEAIKNDAIISESTLQAEDIVNLNEKDEDKKIDKIRKKDKKLLKQSRKKNIEKITVVDAQVESVSNEEIVWGNIEFHHLLQSSLVSLSFSTPTPIQSISIPMIAKGNCDLVGAAETGSGKTLAFGLPIIDYLLKNWDDWTSYSSRNSVSVCPCALILAPTRELAMQITSVLKEVTKSFVKLRRIEIISVVGGMSEQKQKRQLGEKSRPAHIIVGTPGRLCEMVQNGEIPAFRDLSGLRFLVLDEADRMVEEGHYPELHRLFSRIRDHEKIAEDGRDVIEEARKKARGTFEQEASDEDGEEVGEEGAAFEKMPSEEAIAAARLAQCEPVSEPNQPAYRRRGRQTLLYSATALRATVLTEQDQRAAKRLKGISKQLAAALPLPLTQLLSAVAVQGNTRIADVTAQAITSTPVPQPATTAIATLPPTLSLFELRVPTEEKDMCAYAYLLKQNGRILLFVNSIKSARRVDGLLRALGMNCRAIHAQLQQRQRIRALESFRDDCPSTGCSVLVATDVAGRGLDIPLIDAVVHYDIARSPQVFIHRSGRTARAGKSGVALSLVSPEDAQHQQAVLETLAIKAMPTLPFNVSQLPAVAQRVQLAKKIFTQSFVLSQKCKETSWLNANAAESDLAPDEFLQMEQGDSEEQAELTSAAKRKLDAARSELRSLLSQPLDATVAARRPEDRPMHRQVKVAGKKHKNIAKPTKRRSSLVVFAK